jgi:hypothetical protein
MHDIPSFMSDGNGSTNREKLEWKGEFLELCPE